MIFWNVKYWNFEIKKQLKSRRGAPGNDEDPRKTIFEILDVNVVSIKKHEMDML